MPSQIGRYEIRKELGPPSRPSIWRLPAEVEYVVARAMARAPPDRYSVARLFAEDIEDVLAGRTPRHRAGWSMPRPGERTIACGRLEAPVAEQELQLIPDEEGPSPSPPRRRRRPAAALVTLLLAAAAGYFCRGSSWSSSSTTSARAS